MLICENIFKFILFHFTLLQEGVNVLQLNEQLSIFFLFV